MAKLGSSIKAADFHLARTISQLVAVHLPHPYLTNYQWVMHTRSIIVPNQVSQRIARGVTTVA
jgi:hypothetical protein